MTDRLKEIFINIDECEVFADVGCDHGYIAKAMLKSGKSKKVIVSDISAKCLQKAIDLLSKEIAENKAVAIVSDGFKNLPQCDLALIAGMGGEEIISIIENAPKLPEKLILQPMKNLEKVRTFLVEKGYKIILDYVFYKNGKFYDLIKVEKGIDTLTQEEIEFGRTNLIEKGSAFTKRLKEDIKKLSDIKEGGKLGKESLLKIQAKIERLSKYV